MGHYHSINLSVSICMHCWYISISEVSFSDIMIFMLMAHDVTSVMDIMSHDTGD